jgi:hypothetical protein
MSKSTGLAFLFETQMYNTEATECKIEEGIEGISTSR